MLVQGCFDIRQWASNCPMVTYHLKPSERALSPGLVLSIVNFRRTFGLTWHFAFDILGYKHRPVLYHQLKQDSLSSS